MVGEVKQTKQIYVYGTTRALWTVGREAARKNVDENNNIKTRLRTNVLGELWLNAVDGDMKRSSPVFVLNFIACKKSISWYKQKLIWLLQLDRST